MKHRIRNFLIDKFGKYVKLCPKSGKIVAFEPPKTIVFLLFPVLGILAIAWFLIRTIEKPYRASYPCQKIAAGIGISFLTFIAGTVASLALFKTLKNFFRNLSKPILTGICISLSLCFGLATVFVVDSIVSEPKIVYADWNPTDSPNSPIGSAQGINPGRVVWAHNGDATANTVTGSWWQSGNTNQTVVKSMFASSVQTLTGQATVASSWDALFRSFNQKKGRGNVGYANGETVAIKINHVNTSSQTKYGTAIDCCAEVLLAVVEQLVTAGVPQTSIIVYDGGVGTVASYIYNLVNAAYPGVIFRAATGWGSVQTEQWVDNGITYSANAGSTDAETRRVARSVYDATYLVNLALLKKHEDQTAITLCGKNHFGSIKNCRLIHTSINDHNKSMGAYNSLVDLGGHDRIGGKTVLYIIDGLWGAPSIMGSPVKWASAPFNNDWPSSIFMAQDGVAIDSVGLDFINMEHTLWANADNYLHEMAQANNPPSGTTYDPEADGTRMQSLGTHEHWNNTSSKQYSRNLGTGNGIELVTAGGSVPTAGPTAVPTITPTAGPAGTLGDTNGNSAVDIVDALLVAQYYVGLNPANFIVANADVNRDGSVTIVDALRIAQCYVGLVSCAF